MASFSSTDELAAFAAALAGQYEVEREIGRGGMGVVYLARDLRLDRMVAIKTLPPSRAGDAGIRERFLREARTVARLAHPNIVPIHRADEIAGQVFFVMGFVDGDSLATRLAAGPLSPRDTVPILRDVAGALAYAHRHGVVHRDVKTENILLDAANGRAMVTDFGIARLTEAAPLTATGQVLGTVYYLSPEQVTGDTVDARSDIYALGVVGYAALAGKFPFDGVLASAVLVAHVMNQALPLSAAAPHVPPSLTSIIDRCLAKNPAHRFQSCADLDAALAAVQSEADRVSIAAPATRSRLVSDTEAQAVFKRAAELQDMTGVQPLPVAVSVRRDAERDAQRTSGFKTADLRQAAEEAGIGDDHMQRALAERGLRPQPPSRGDRRPAGIVFDLGKKGGFFQAEPTDLPFEMVVNGEIPEEDFDLLVEVVRRHAERERMTGTAASVGKTFTWSGHTFKHFRELGITVAPRQGRTTIRVAESIRQIAHTAYGVVLGAGGLTFVSVAAEGGFGATAAAMGAITLLAGYAIAGTALREFSTKRKAAIKELLSELAAQVRESDSLNRK
jgi:hypothetical protein